MANDVETYIQLGNDPEEKVRFIKRTTKERFAEMLDVLLGEKLILQNTSAILRNKVTAKNAEVTINISRLT